MSNKLGQEPAFPQLEVCDGMSKRFYATCAAMQGLLAGRSARLNCEFVAEEAFRYADELLKQESDETN